MHTLLLNDSTTGSQEYITDYQEKGSNDSAEQQALMKEQQKALMKKYHRDASYLTLYLILMLDSMNPRLESVIHAQCNTGKHLLDNLLHLSMQYKKAVSDYESDKLIKREFKKVLTSFFSGISIIHMTNSLLDANSKTRKQIRRLKSDNASITINEHISFMIQKILGQAKVRIHTFTKVVHATYALAILFIEVEKEPTDLAEIIVENIKDIIELAKSAINNETSTMEVLTKKARDDEGLTMEKLTEEVQDIVKQYPYTSERWSLCFGSHFLTEGSIYFDLSNIKTLLMDVIAGMASNDAPTLHLKQKGAVAELSIFTPRQSADAITATTPNGTPKITLSERPKANLKPKKLPTKMHISTALQCVEGYLMTAKYPGEIRYLPSSLMKQAEATGGCFITASPGETRYLPSLLMRQAEITEGYLITANPDEIRSFLSSKIQQREDADTEAQEPENAAHTDHNLSHEEFSLC